MRNPYLIDSDPELLTEVDKLQRQEILNTRRDEDRRLNDRQMVYFDD